MKLIHRTGAAYPACLYVTEITQGSTTSSREQVSCPVCRKLHNIKENTHV